MSEDSTSDFTPEDYTLNSPLYQFFTNDKIREPLLQIIKDREAGIKTTLNVIMCDEVLDLFIDMGFIFEDPLEINKHHNLTKIIETPQVSRILSNDTAIAVLNIHLQKTYLPLIPIDTLEEFSGSTPDEIKEAQKLLTNFNILQSSMIMSGHGRPEDEWEGYENLIQSVQNLHEKMDENESIDVSSLKNITDMVVSNPTKRDEKIVLSEEELLTRINESYSEPVETIKMSNNNISTLEPGETGKTLNKENPLSEHFYNLQTNLLSYNEKINKM